MVSVAAVVVFSRLTGRDLFGVYNLSEVIQLTLSLGLLGVGVAEAWIRLRRGRHIVVTAETPPSQVLRAARQAGNTINRKVYVTDNGEHGLLVQRDRGAYVLSPPILFNRGDELVEALRETDDGNRFDKVIAALSPDFESPHLRQRQGQRRSVRASSHRHCCPDGCRQGL